MRFQFEIRIRGERLGIVAKADALSLQQPGSGRIAECAHNPTATVGQRMDLLLVVPNRQGELKNVVRLTELNLPGPIAGGFQSVTITSNEPRCNADTSVSQSEGERIPACDHGRRQRVDHFLFVTDILVGMVRVVEDVGRAAARVRAPAESLLAEAEVRQDRDDETEANQPGSFSE